MFNIYNNGERITDSRTFEVKVNSFERKSPGVIVNSDVALPGDTSKNLGYDYNYLRAGKLFSKRTAEIVITKGTEVMKIIFDNEQASPWTSLGMDRIDFKKGVFTITQTEWPNNRKDRPMDYRFFPYIDENFDWENIRTK